MLEVNSIKEFFKIKDDCIKIIGFEVVSEGDVQVNVIKANLTSNKERCPHCGRRRVVHGEVSIVKNGTKLSKIVLGNTIDTKTVLFLDKQKYHCRQCNNYYTAETKLVNRHCFISNHVFLSISKELRSNASATSIAKRYHISLSTVVRVIQSLRRYTKRGKHWLPEVFLVDEFNGLKKVGGKYVFTCADGESGELFDILPTRDLKYLKDHFLSFSRKARMKVKYVVTDMHSAYFTLAKECFPKAKIIVDRFHIVQHINRIFNKERIRVMNSLRKQHPSEGKQYRQLKSLWGLLLKPREKLNNTAYKSRRNYDNSQLTETEVVDRLLMISDELKQSYVFFQELLEHLRNKDSKQFFDTISGFTGKASQTVKDITKTCLKYRKEIRNAINQPYSNGKLECKHTHIKTLKRNLYGFRNYANTKVRIFLINDLIKIG